jgi:hypothetical protein
MNKLISALCAVSALALATPAAAQLVQTGTGTATVTTAGTGGTATFFFDGNVGGTTITGLSSELILTYLGATPNTPAGDTTLNFSFTLLDTGSVGSRVSGFGFNSSPAPISGDQLSGLFNQLLISGNFPNGIGTIDVCLLANPGGGGGAGCGGGSSGGVVNGQTTNNTGLFSLVYNDSPATINLSGFHTRYQSIVGVNGGTSGTGSPVPGVPEPATWAMMMLGFAGIGMTLRRRRNGQVLAQVA